MSARWTTITSMMKRLAGLVAVSTVVTCTVAQPATSVAASLVSVANPDTSLVTETILTTDRLALPPVGAARTQAQVIIPGGAHWEIAAAQGSVLLTVASGSLEITIDAGTAHISQYRTPGTLHDLPPGEPVVLTARDRLVLHGSGTIRTRNAAQEPVIAAVVYVE